MSKRTTHNYYSVLKGLDPGIYSKWEGGNGAKARVEGISRASHKGFYNVDEAIEYYKEQFGGIEPERWDLLPPYNYFAVVDGNETGIFKKWFGENGAEESIGGYHEPLFKGFHDLDSAKDWYRKETGKEPKLRFDNEQE